jgi:tRNA(Phe) wybutosine-synthesizing methylase Tyw3
MPSGQEKMEALKKAGLLRRAAMQAGFRSPSVAGQGNKASVAANATSEVEPV